MTCARTPFQPDGNISGIGVTTAPSRPSARNTSTTASGAGRAPTGGRVIAHGRPQDLGQRRYQVIRVQLGEQISRDRHSHRVGRRSDAFRAARKVGSRFAPVGLCVRSEDTVPKHLQFIANQGHPGLHHRRVRVETHLHQRITLVVVHTVLDAGTGRSVPPARSADESKSPHRRWRKAIAVTCRSRISQGWCPDFVLVGFGRDVAAMRPVQPERRAKGARPKVGDPQECAPTVDSRHTLGRGP